MAHNEKPPSELSFDVFAARVAADETLLESVRQAVADSKAASMTDVLAAVKKAASENEA
jgi:hypothetical protein